MACYDVSGVRSITLYENIGVSFTYNEASGAVTEITNTGNIISIDSSLRPDYINNVSPGANYKLMNLYTVKWYNFDLTTGRALLNQLRNIFGWYAILTFNSGDEYLINVPLFLKSGTQMTSSGTHTWEINLQNEVDSEGALVQYLEPDETNIKNGYLYNWYAANDPKFAPANWKVPTQSEYTTLSTNLGGTALAGGRMKETGTIFWNSPNNGATNESGFTAYGSGARANGNGLFYDILEYFYGWSQTEISGTNGFLIAMWTGYDDLELNTNFNKKLGASVRLLYTGSGEPTNMTDYDGNSYDVVNIEGQYWTVQNWACTKLNDGTPLTKVTDGAAWAALSTEGYCAYNNNESNVFLP